MSTGGTAVAFAEPVSKPIGIRTISSWISASRAFGGTAAIHEFTELHWITVQSGWHPFPF